MKRIHLTLLIPGILAAFVLFSSCALAPVITLTPTPAISKQQFFAEVIPYLDKGTSADYAKAWNTLRPVGNYNGKYWNDEEIQALLWFSFDMINVANGRVYEDDFSLISPDYAVVYHAQISSEVLKHISKAEWIRRYAAHSPLMATAIAKARHPLPAIGMTAQQVLDSQWGAPDRIKKTITAKGIGERWEYAGGKYILFVKGIVTAIQE